MISLMLALAASAAATPIQETKAELAYSLGRCATHYSMEDRKIIASIGAPQDGFEASLVTTSYNFGVGESRREMPTKAQCQAIIGELTAKLAPKLASK